MCTNAIDPTIETALNDTVVEFMNQARMFTGYVVTIETRKREGIQLRHRDVRGNIHDLPAIKDAIAYGHEKDGETLNWDVQQVTIPGSTSGEAPFVYFREGQDPTDYQFLDNQGQPVQGTPTAVPVAQASISVVVTPSDADDETKALTKGGKNSDGTYSPDNYNRLWIPKQLLKDAGLEPGETCTIVSDPDESQIHLVLDASSINTDETTVNTKLVQRHSGCMCLWKKQLKAADIQDSGSFVIESSDFQGQSGIKITGS